ncbi:MAG: phenylalanine--tRNA ligase subunit beta [Alphaproteobacteria bacterium]|nr:phenylalanine--tRNA ligase subunit beta [Alphaproteobacteria bacterium]
MKFTLSWLKDHLDTTAQLSEILERLTMLGLEVEGVDDPASALTGFIVGHVVEANQHPNADRLRVCKVDTGKGTIQVVCGAPNARTGIKVALALPGTVIPANGEALKKGAIRGQESQGMMCSNRELKLGEDHDGIIELDASAPVGAPLVSVLSLDPMIEIAITPNRADCLGVRGIARDLAAAGLGSLKPLETLHVPGKFKSPIDVRIDASHACPLFIGRYIRGVKNGESPKWLKDRLTAIGLRPISALVDVTNYITFDLARPLHVFDAAKVKGTIHPRLAKAGETLEALNGKTYALDQEMTVIADDHGPEALGGVIGGVRSGCTEATTDVFVESALFDSIRTANTGRKLQADSDARYRFERHVDPEFAQVGMEIATRMILDLCGGEASELVIAGSVPDWKKSFVLRPERVAQHGGIHIVKEAIERILMGLGCTVAEHGNGILVSPPSWRADIGAEHDLVEEVIRVYGYDHVPAASVPKLSAITTPVLTQGQKRRSLVRRTLAGRGMNECVTWSFMPKTLSSLFGGGADQLTLANPISSDLDQMRPSLLGNLVQALGRNADRGTPDLALFEIGPQYAGTKPEDQASMASGVRAGVMVERNWAAPSRAVDAFDAKADALAALSIAQVPTDNLQIEAEAPGWYHPGRSGSLKLGPKVLAWFGELHPRVLKALDVKGPVVGFELFLDNLPPAKVRPTKARPALKASPFQAVVRDFAFLVDRAVTAQALIKAARSADKILIVGAQVFDLYEGKGVEEGKKSLAIAVTLLPTERTLTDAEIEAVAAKVVDAVTKATGATLRG